MNDDSYQVDAEGKVILTPQAVELLDRGQAQAVANAIFERFGLRGKLKPSSPHEHEWEELGDGGMFYCKLCDEDGTMWCLDCEVITSADICPKCGAHRE